MRAPALAAQELAADTVGQVDVAGDGVNRGLVGVVDDVDDIGQVCGAGGIQHIVVDGVAVHYAGAAVRIVDELAVVVVDDGLAGGDAGQDALAAVGTSDPVMNY